MGQLHRGAAISRMADDESSQAAYKAVRAGFDAGVAYLHLHWARATSVIGEIEGTVLRKA